ncbi:oxygenase MpaB family protein [Nocardioides sp. R-C-SC26]|uniref:oxygenase MpaB family protein n=1 Tax=Nocardioides sp. R-C-SC26 TaxID=2870414 RepID=UPI001E490597|nr:oxygenase MpaB family protein [Nocardioides sp. R-C-SC26]
MVAEVFEARDDSRQVPTSLRRRDEARRRFGAAADTYFDAMWDGDPLADAFVADFADLGHGRAMRMLRTACRQGIEAVPDAPLSLRALFEHLDARPAWVDTARIDHGSRHVPRYTRQAGIVLGAASLLSGYANSAASRPLEMTGRYVENAGARTVEVGSWLVAVNAPGGLERFSEGFELTVRVRVIHALVRADLLRRPAWDVTAWGVPICQSYLAYTLIEFALIPMRSMAMIGAPHLPHERAASYARWRYLGHLLGIDDRLLPRDAADQERLEALYLMTRPVVDDYCRSLVASINREFLVPEVDLLLPGPAQRLSLPAVHAMERLFLGDEIADDLQIPRTRLTTVIRGLGAVLGAVNALLDRLPPMLALRTRLGQRFQAKQMERLRRDWGVQHDLVDASPSGGVPHPARGDQR